MSIHSFILLILLDSFTVVSMSESCQYENFGECQDDSGCVTCGGWTSNKDGCIYCSFRWWHLFLVIVASLLLLAVFGFLIYWFCKRKTTKHEKEPKTSQSSTLSPDQVHVIHGPPPPQPFYPPPPPPPEAMIVICSQDSTQEDTDGTETQTLESHQQPPYPSSNQMAMPDQPIQHSSDTGDQQIDSD